MPPIKSYIQIALWATAELLAGALGVTASRVVLVSGAHSRLKRFRISEMAATEVVHHLEIALGVAG